MLKRSRGRLRKPRYEARRNGFRDDRAWMVIDTRTSRLLAINMRRNAAERLAHTLNVADLSEPVVDYRDDPNDQSSATWPLWNY